MGENWQNFRKETYQGTENTEISKQDDPKEIHSKTYHN